MGGTRYARSYMACVQRDTPLAYLILANLYHRVIGWLARTTKDERRKQYKTIKDSLTITARSELRAILYPELLAVPADRGLPACRGGGKGAYGSVV